ncbi:hypothetical protein NN561_006842 [Cricetulus griseus]
MLSTLLLRKLRFRAPALMATKASVLTRCYSLSDGILGCLSFFVHTEEQPVVAFGLTNWQELREQQELLRSHWYLYWGNIAYKQEAYSLSGENFFIVSDQFYRYKMPRLIAKVEGKGNGIKTVIVNMVDVAKALNRPPTYPTKYFGCELGAQTQFDVKNDRYIVNGSHEANKLQDMLDGFIKKFVLCPECENPETDLEEEEDDDWGEDTTEEAQRRRMDEISDHAKVLTLSDDLERTIEERVNILFDFVKKKKEEGIIDSSDKEIVAEAERLDVKAMGPLVLTEVLFNEKIREQIKKYRRHFLRFCHNNKKAQRYLLHGLECVVAMHQAQLISKIPHILKEMYDADLLEEEVIISWSEKVVYSKTASVPKVETVKSDNKDDDIDIDAI